MSGGWEMYVGSATGIGLVMDQLGYDRWVGKGHGRV